jgi:succinate dehydrogenase / fumarate reductase cytochrome b subunit
MADAARGVRPRPLSPHLQVWRWHVTMATSIAHRASGVALYVGALILMGWALSLAFGPDAYATYKGLLGSILGKIVLFAITLAAFFHLGNGLRHLSWDAGGSLDPKLADKTGVAAFAFAVVATVAVWGLAFLMGAL